MFLTIGAEGELVAELQDRLADRGYDVGPVDGQFGRRTREAVAELQREHELATTGGVTAPTAEELGLELDAPDVPEARSEFGQLVMKNPNYFGNRPSLSFEPVVEKIGDSSYEGLTCVGYDPGTSQLEAVVSLERDTGYGGDVCTDGSVEYVRFFLDRERDGTWEDVGVASTRVYDMPGPNPVDYALSVELDQPLEPCDTAVLPRVRAILSWQTEPPAGDETYRPVWGDRREADVQLEPRLPTVGDVVAEDLLGPDLLNGMDLDAPMSFDPPTLGASQLLTRYEGTSVPPHRAGFGDLKQLLGGPLPSGPGGSGGPGDPSGPVGPFPEPVPEVPELPEIPAFDPFPDLDIDTEDLVDDLFETTGNTSYEELDCVGYRRGVLTGVLTIKRPSGYSGGLCTAGSPEHVAFWEKPPGGGTWSHVGTGSVTVHDIPSLPGDGLQYAVHLPADLSHHRTPCDDGPSLVRVRAVVSWNRKPPSGDPTFVPTWGNRVETLVQVPPGPDPGEGLLEVGTLGNVVPTDVDQTTGTDTTGTATGPLVSSGGSVNATAAAFGGRVTITGRKGSRRRRAGRTACSTASRSSHTTPHRVPTGRSPTSSGSPRTRTRGRSRRCPSTATASTRTSRASRGTSSPCGTRAGTASTTCGSRRSAATDRRWTPRRSPTLTVGRRRTWSSASTTPPPRRRSTSPRSSPAAAAPRRRPTSVTFSTSATSSVARSPQTMSTSGPVRPAGPRTGSPSSPAVRRAVLVRPSSPPAG